MWDSDTPIIARVILVFEGEFLNFILLVLAFCIQTTKLYRRHLKRMWYLVDTTVSHFIRKLIVPFLDILFKLDV